MIAIIQKVIDKCGISKREAERKWKKAEQLVQSEYGFGINTDDEIYYDLVIKVFKKLLGRDCVNKLKSSGGVDEVKSN